MVFITMSQDEALSRTAHYQIICANKNREESTWQPSQHDRPYAVVERDHSAAILSVRHHRDGTTSTRVRRPAAFPSEDDDSRRVASLPMEFTMTQPELNVTTECSDAEEDQDFTYMRTLRRTPTIGSLPFENRDSDSDDGILFGSEDFADAFGMQSSGDANMSLAEACDAHAYATQEAVRAVGGELLTPHTKFHIEKKKRKCTIRFDPPVSGKFILLKMWSSSNEARSTVDIQSIIARGYAGPRYFPSVDLV